MAAPSTIVKDVIAARIEDFFYQDNIWIPRVQDESAEIAVQGKTITIVKPLLSTYASTPKVLPVSGQETSGPDGTFTEDSTADQLKRGDPTIYEIDSVDLTVNKVYDIDFAVSAISEKRVRPNLMMMHSQQVAREVREQMNADIRSAYDGAANEVSTAISVTNATWGQDAHLTDIQEALEAATLAADTTPHYFPNDGRVCIVGPAIYSLIRKYLVKEKLFLTSGITDAAAARAEVIEWEGWQIIKDNSIGIAHTATDDGNHSMYFMVNGYPAVAAAYELNMERVFESEIYRATRAVGTFTWGHAIINDAKLLIQKHDITA